MIKKILIGLVLLIVIGLGVLYFTINGIVSNGVTSVFNKMGPEITGTDTRIEGADVQVFQGNIGIKGLFIGNPEGFKSPSAMACDEIYIDVDPGSIFSDRIAVNEIRIVAPSFSYEQNLAGNNLSKLKNQIDENSKKFTGDKPAPAEDQSEEVAEASQKTLVLHKLIVSDGKVDLAVLTVNKEVPLPEINKDFGGEGVEPAEAIDYVLSLVIEKVVEQAAVLAREVLNDPSAVADQLTKSGTDAVKGAGDAANKAGDAIKGLFD